MRIAIALLALHALAIPARPAQAQELGRLFHTPEQREALDARRKAPLPDKPVAPAPARFTRVDGYVLRADGRTTVWLNGEAIPAGSAADDVRAFVRRDDPGRALLSVAGKAATIRVKVGATLEHAAGKAHDPIGEGEIRVGR